MKWYACLLPCLLLSYYVFSQPENDDCSAAIELNLSTPFPFPDDTPVIDTFYYDNLEATPSLPFPKVYDCAGGDTSSWPAADIWFSFQAVSPKITIDLEGLEQPNLLLYEAGFNCAVKYIIGCAVSEPGEGNLSLEMELKPGQDYFLQIFGGSLTDRGHFTLLMSSAPDDDPCNYAGQFFAAPPPQNGTYSPGQTVQFCYTVQQWDISGAIEWLHALEPKFGDGWELSTLTTQPPPSCSGSGFWKWFEQWTSCNTGLSFGPGFAYESVVGVGCGGAPIDGDPGNNWGDGGNGCGAIGSSAPAVDFCWTLSVKTPDNLPPNANLNVEVDVHSDGYSGSWFMYGCNTEQDYRFYASSDNTPVEPPYVAPIPAVCPGQCTGSLSIAGASGEAWSYLLLDENGQSVFQHPFSQDTVIADGLCDGNYDLQLTAQSTGATASFAVTVSTGPGLSASATYSGPVCEGNNIQLFGSTDTSGIDVSYSWIGPGGFSSAEQNPIVPAIPGDYTLLVSAGDCTSEPAMVVVSVFDDPEIMIDNSDDFSICPGSSTLLEASGAESYQWYEAGTLIGAGSTITVSPEQSSTYTVLATDANACTAAEAFTIELLPLPELPAIDCNTGYDSVLFEWEDQGDGFSYALSLLSGPVGVFSGNSYFVDNMAQAQQVSILLTVTDPEGCKNSQTVSCTTLACSNIIVELDSLPAICLAEDSASIILQASVSGQQGSGAGSWSGAGVINAETGLFHPLLAGTGTHELTYSYIEGPCIETQILQIDILDGPVSAPTISCESLPGSVTFSWEDIPGAAYLDFEVMVNDQITGPPAVQNNTLTIDDLTPGDEVLLILQAGGAGGCGQVEASASCTASACPDNVELLPIIPQDICLSEASQAFTLTAGLANSLGEGSFSWSGPGITDTAAGIFDPLVAGEGASEITVTYTEGPCIYTESFTLFIDSVPELALADAVFVCTGETMEYCLPDAQSYLWTGPGGTTVATSQCLIYPEFEEEWSGTFGVSVAFSDYCTATDSIQLSVHPTLELIDFPEDTVVCPYVLVPLQATVGNADYFFWYPGGSAFCATCASTVAMIYKPETFTLIALDENGCELEASFEVEIGELCPKPDTDINIGNLIQTELEDRGQSGNLSGGEARFRIYPNPARSSIDLETQNARLLQVELWSSQGQRMAVWKEPGHKLRIPLDGWMPGSYQLRLITLDGVWVRSILVQ